MPKSLVAIALAAALAACSAQPNPETMPAPATDLSAMNGSWIGEYTNDATWRSGSISLSLRTWTDSAAGDVVLVPRGASALMAADVAGHMTRGISPEVLHLSFKRVGGGMVEATVEPYYSPDCACVVTMVLQTTPEKNLLSGAFVLTSASGLRQQGRWSVERQMVASR